jgi:hypothetical protein
VEPELFVSLSKRFTLLLGLGLSPQNVLARYVCCAENLWPYLRFPQFMDAQRAKVKDILDGLQINKDY